MSKTKEVELSGLQLFLIQNEESPFNIALSQCGIRDFVPRSMHIERIDETHIRCSTQLYIVDFEIERNNPPIFTNNECDPYKWTITKAVVSDPWRLNSQLPKTINFVNYEKTKFHLLGVIRHTGFRDFLIYQLLCKLIGEIAAGSLLNELWRIPAIRATREGNLIMHWSLPDNSTNVSSISLKYDGTSFQAAVIRQNRRNFVFEKKKGEWYLNLDKSN